MVGEIIFELMVYSRSMKEDISIMIGQKGNIQNDKKINIEVLIQNIIRFCFNSSKTISMFIYFPGYGIQMSTIDPSFLIKEYPLSSKAWFDVKLLMKIRENLPKDATRCKTKEYSNIGDLVKIHTDHEQCILQNFEKNWSKRNQSCYTFVIQNYLEANM